MAEGERELLSKYNLWKKSGKDVTPGQMMLTDQRLVFAGHVPKSFGRGMVADLLISAIVAAQQRNREKSFEIPLTSIRGARQPDGLMNRGALDIETAERTYRVTDRKTWERPLRDAVEGAGIAVVDEPKGWHAA